MTDVDPTPSSEAVEAVQQHWQDDTDTFDRVYQTLLGLTEPTPYTDIGDIAQCSPNAAKKHAERLTEMGIALADRDSRPPRYQRNDAYLEWQDASRLAADFSVEEIISPGPTT
ncbi:MAG: hypothetical protein U5K37_00535 [Natrialbaceae archaeon]|nr:hypothetical protein [Natrialbaceae archaeon]